MNSHQSIRDPNFIVHSIISKFDSELDNHHAVVVRLHDCTYAIPYIIRVTIHNYNNYYAMDSFLLQKWF